MSRRALLVLFLAVFIDLLGFGIVIPLLPVYADQLQASDLTIGLLLASFSFMQFLFAPVWGRLSDRIGRRPILLMGLASSCLFYGLFALASYEASLWLMFVSRIGGGIAGATIPTAQAYIADVTEPEKRASRMALLGMAFGLGFTFGPLIGAGTVGWASTGHLPVGPGLAASVLSGSAFLIGLAWLAEPRTRRPTAETVVRERLAWSVLWSDQVGRSVRWLVLCSFLVTLAFANFETTLSRYVKDVFGFDYRQLFLLFAGIGCTLAIAQGALVRPLVKRIHELPMIVLGCTLLIVGLVGLAAAASSGRWLYLVVPTLLTVTGYAALPPSLQALMSRRSSEHVQGTVLGIGQSASAMARILGPVVGNLLYAANAAHNLPYTSGAVIAGVVLVLSATLGRS